MWRRTLLTVALVGACMWCLATVQQVHSDEKQQAAEKAEKKACYEPVAPVHDLMEAQGYHFKEITGKIRSRKSDPENKDERQAKDDYRLLSRHAYILAELANVNQHNSEKEDYTKWAQEVRDMCVELAQAARKQDLKAADTITRAIHAKCGQCHDKYE